MQCSVLGGGEETCPEKCLHGNDVFTVRASAVRDDCQVRREHLWCGLEGGGGSGAGRGSAVWQLLRRPDPPAAGLPGPDTYDFFFFFFSFSFSSRLKKEGDKQL